MKIGISAIFGIGNPNETSGSKNHRTVTKRAIRSPSATPATAAIANPAKAR
jgi:hypothetical protein